MNKNILIISFAVAILGLTALAFISWNDSETATLEIASNETVIETIAEKEDYNFAFNVATRFNGITKEDLNKVTTFADFIAEEHANRIVSYKSLDIIIIKDERQTNVRVDGHGGEFNEAQIEFLQSLPYSTHIKVWADYTEHEFETGVLQESHWTPHLTIVPEKEVVYNDGDEALIAYLREHTQKRTAHVDEKKLRPGNLYFTVTKTGTIDNVRLVGTSGYSGIDEEVIELIKNIPGSWEPAENAQGEKVDQELTLSFGTTGC